jgi:Mg-chelatase subunit ChlD
MRLKPWEVVLFIAAAVCVVIFVLARTVGARSASREGMVTRIARPGVAFWPEPVEVDVRISARRLPKCADAGDVSPVQVALVIDQSGSMSGPPLIEARNAASDFVDLMNLQKDGDLVAVISFNAAAYVQEAFTHKRGNAISAIQGIQDGGGTNIAAGLTAATEELAAQSVTTDTRQVIILLSDGKSDAAAAIAAADAAKAQGFSLYTIALGDADTDTLSQIASTPDAYYATADPNDLMNIYSDIAAGIVGTVATDIAVTEHYNDERFNQVGNLYRATSTTNPIQWEAPFMGARGRSMGYFLRPKGLGMPRVSLTQGQMSLVDCNGQTVSQSTSTGPRVLVLFPVWLLFPIPALALLWLLYRVIQALKPAPTGPVIAPGMRTGSVPGKKVKKEDDKRTGASIQHGQPKKPPKR